MFLSFLKSMQTKSQDAQNPGLWVNGNRQPIQENIPQKKRKIDPDLNGDGQFSKAEQELIAQQLGDPLEDTVPTKAGNTAKKLTKNFFDEHM